MRASTTNPASLGGRLLNWALLLTVLAGGVVGAEWLLRWRYLQIARSDRLAPGLSRVDSQVGWTLSPRWTGTHEHHDFRVRYSINNAGFRGADVRHHRPPSRLVAVLGDSFTFGTGVDDADTFTERLDRQAPASRRVYNFAVPGYSTDQELLVAERDVLPLSPHTIVLVVYLANDLFDNQLSESLQVRRRKPVFVLREGRLTLTGPPPSNAAPGSRSPANAPSLFDMISGRRPENTTALQRLEARSYLFRLVTEAVPLLQPAAPEFARDQAYALELFWALVERLRDSAAAKGTRLVLALLGGQSLVEAPHSLSARFQEFFRDRLARDAGRQGVPLIDVAQAMRARFEREGGRWFHPNEGHLNREGHRMVAEIIGAADL